MANLLQISSAYGRAMETLNRARMCEVLYPVLLDQLATLTLSVDEADTVIVSCTEGYPFPTNLDSDPPVGGLAPESQQALFARALGESWAVGTFVAAIRRQAAQREA